MPENAAKVVQGCLTLRNWLCTHLHELQVGEVDKKDDNGNMGVWRDLVPLDESNQIRGQCVTQEMKLLRDFLNEYYNSDVGGFP